MGQAIGDILPLAIGVALSPVPIIGVILMLATPRARANGLAFVAGWIAGLATVGTLVLLASDGAGASDQGDPKTWVGVLQLVLGAGLLVLAVHEFRIRPRGGEDPPLPKWMAAIDTFTTPKAAAFGFLLSGPNPKNLLLGVAAGTAIAQAGLSGAEQAIALGVFVVVGTLGPGLPVAVYFLAGSRAGEILGDLRAWMSHNNAVIMAVVLLVIGAKVLGAGIGALSG